MTTADALSYSCTGQHPMEASEALPATVIAAVSGPALGGGCELVLGCDLAVCTGDATFGQIEVNGGSCTPSVAPGAWCSALATSGPAR